MTEMTSDMGRGEPPADQAEGDRDGDQYAEQRANYDDGGDSGGGVERGGAEDLSGAPLTDTEREVSQPPDER